MNTQQLLVKHILERWDSMAWSIQGFGMLRTYLSKEVRLHIWDPEFMVPGVSTVHDHPWDFTSEIVCGEITNQLYNVFSRDEDGMLRLEPHGPAYKQLLDAEPTHMRATIRCGTGGGLEKACHFGEPVPVFLVGAARGPQKYTAGMDYSQHAAETHETAAVAGTVTIVTRKFCADTEHAHVCYPIGTEWVSAEPRTATPGEIRAFVDKALARLTEEKP